MNLAGTGQNRALAAAVNSQIKAEARNLSARAAFWRLLGIGSMLALAGIGVGAGFLGYSYTLDATSSARTIGEAISRALASTPLHTTGAVRLDAADASVRLDAKDVALQAAPLKLDPAATVHMDPAAQVGIRGAFERPTPQQLKVDSQPAGVVTNYTIFKGTPFKGGQVITGWNFSSSQQARPTNQYCYFALPPHEGIKTSITLAEDGMATTSQTYPDGFDAKAFDMKAATSRCVWFDAGRAD